MIDQPLSKPGAPTPADLAMDLAQHLRNLTEYYRNPLIADQVTHIRGFYHIGGHAAAIRRALHAEEHATRLEAALREIITLLAPLLNPAPLDLYWASASATEAASAALGETP